MKRTFCIIAVIMSMMMGITGCNSEKSSYNKGVKALENSLYDEAIEYFTQAGEYENSGDKIIECYYGKGVEAQNAEDYETAIDCFNKTNGYEDSNARASECQHAVDVLNDKTPPVISGIEDKINVTCGTVFNLNDYISAKIVIEDDVTQDISDYSVSCDEVYDRGTGNIDTTVNGEFTVNITAKDEAENNVEKSIMLSLNPVEVSKEKPNPTIYDGEYGVIKVKAFRHGEVYEYSDINGYYVVFDVENKCEEPVEIYWSMYTSINDYQVPTYYEDMSLAPGKKGTALSYIEDKDIPEEIGNFSQIDSIVCIKRLDDDKSFYRIPATFYTNAIE